MDPWYGPTCNYRYSACAWQKDVLENASSSSNEVCLNGGTCQENPVNFGYICNCPRGWKGQRCEEPDVRLLIPRSFSISTLA